MPENESWPQLAAHHVLIDMDDTITYTTAPPSASLLKGIESGEYFLAILRNLVARKRGISDEAALGVITGACDPSRRCLFTILAEICIEMEEYWGAVLDYHRGHLGAYPDAVEMIRTLHARGFRLCTATTNSRMAALSKLTFAGLADMNDSPYFADFFGGDNCEGGKSGPQFFRAILERGGFDPSEVLMIGDNPVADLASAKAAGIEQVVLPRRDQPEDLVVEDDGGIYVRSLAIVPDLLRPER